MTDTSPGIEPWDVTNFILIFTPAKCVICGKLTNWVELSFEAPLHPGPCDVLMWSAYHEANRKAGPHGDI